MTTTTHAQKMDLAMGAAREYARERDRGNMAPLAGLRANLDEFVGRWEGAELRYPGVIAAAMGRPDLALHDPR